MRKTGTKVLSLLLVIFLLAIMPYWSSAALIRTETENPSRIRLSWTEDPQTTMSEDFNNGESKNTDHYQRAYIGIYAGSLL